MGRRRREGGREREGTHDARMHRKKKDVAYFV